MDDESQLEDVLCRLAWLSKIHLACTEQLLVAFDLQASSPVLQHDGGAFGAKDDNNNNKTLGACGAERKTLSVPAVDVRIFAILIF